MNAISTALKDAGVVIPPLNKRVWLWLHDHPEKSSKDIAKALGARHTDTATVLSDMYHRKMVIRNLSPTGPGSGAGYHKEVLVWRTATKTYDLLPKPKKAPKEKFMRPIPVFEKMPDAPVPGIAPPPSFPKVLANALDIEALTLREARVLYNQLKEYFA